MHLHDAQRALQRFAQTGARYLLTNVRETRVGVGCGFLGLFGDLLLEFRQANSTSEKGWF